MELVKNENEINDYLIEHLKSFILVGYDIRGDSVLLISGKTPQDYDAMETLLKRISSLVNASVK